MAPESARASSAGRSIMAAAPVACSWYSTNTAGQDGGAISVPYAERLLEDCLRSCRGRGRGHRAERSGGPGQQEMLRLLGYDELEMIGRSWTGMFASRRDRRRASEYFDGLCPGEGPAQRTTTRPLVTTKGGQKRCVAWHHVTPLRNASGNVPGLDAHPCSISLNRRESRRPCEDQERLYRLVSENATAGVWTYDIGTRARSPT